MKELIGQILAVLGFILLGVCGLGFTVSVVAWVLSLLGIPFITGAGSLIFKFAGGWLLGAISTVLGRALII